MRNRRFFTDDFKKELVFKLETHQISLEAVENQFKIPKPLTRKWCDKYRGISDKIAPIARPANPSNAFINARINQLVISLVEQKLEELVNAKTLNQTLLQKTV